VDSINVSTFFIEKKLKWNTKSITLHTTGKKIGESYYLVEMATDGRTLTITAYDGDTQKTLELLV